MFFNACFQPEDEDEPFILEDTCLLNTENIDAHSCETSSLASSDSGDRTHLKRNGHFLNLATHQQRLLCIDVVMHVWWLNKVFSFQ